MKKVLFATTALVAFAGAASADVAISGAAEMGIYDNGTAGNVAGNGAQLFQDIDVNFKMSGETDGGVSFGAAVDLDEAGKLADVQDDQGVALFVSGGFGTVTLGDTDGALDWAMTEVTGPGTIADNETAHGGWGGSYLDGDYDGQIVRYDYSFGDVAVAISMETTNGDQNDSTQGHGYAVGLKYDLDLGGNTIALGVGHQTVDLTGTADDVDATGVSVSGTFGALTAGVVYTDIDATGTANDGDHTWLGVSYAMGALTLGANYGSYDYTGTAADVDGYAVSANYDLGGGAILQAGYNKTNNPGATADVDTWSFGLRMNF